MAEAERAGALIGQPMEEETVSGLIVLKKLSLVAAGLVVLMLIFGVGVALAGDNSNASMVRYDNDNISGGFSVFYPKHCWRGLDTIYYQGDVWESFFKGGVGTSDDSDEICVFVSRQAAADPPASEPTHYRVVEPGQTWSNTDKRISATRFAVFKDKLFLYIGKTYDDNTGMILWQKQIDPLNAEDVDGTRWNPAGTRIWEYRPNDPGNPRIIQGLVVKVINDTIYILVQQSKTRDLYLITSTDAATYSTPQRIYTFAENDCLLNGDVIARGSDGKPLLAFVTKDDANGGGGSTGTCKLWTFDPADDSVSAVATLPNKYMDLTLVAGNAYGCTQDSAAKSYSTTAAQLWGIGWGSNNVYHMQYVFSDDAKSGAFNPTGIVDAGSASGHVEQSDRGYLASCIAPELVPDKTATGADVDSIQQCARVWWWGSTDTANAHGRSLKYKMDYLKNLGSAESDTSSASKIQDSWILQGIIMGMPPYYPNGTEVGHLKDNYCVSYGISATNVVTSNITSEKTLSISYEKKGLFGIPSASIGLSYSNAVQQTSDKTKTTTVTQILEFSPAYKAAIGIPPGSQAWGIFLAPTITNDRYHVYGPDAETNLDIELYYTYISGKISSSLVDKEFDMTVPAAAGAYWSGMKIYPSSMEYGDERWSSDYTKIPDAETTDYKRIFSTNFNAESSLKDWTLGGTNEKVDSQRVTNTVDVSAEAFGFGAEMNGSLSLASSTSTTLGTNVNVRYGCPGWDAFPTPPDDYNDCLVSMNMTMYLLEAKTQDAFWIPAGAKTSGIQSYPWCMTWHVNSFVNVASILGTMPGEVRATALPGVLRASLFAKLVAAKAAFDRGYKVAARIILKATCSQIRAQSGKAIPRATAERWIRLLGLLEPLLS